MPKEKKYYLDIQASGSYSVLGVDSNNCSSMSNELYIERSGINDPADNSILAFPIPIKNKVYIQLPSLLKNSQSLISIYDIYGRQVYVQEFVNHSPSLELDLSQLSNGNYLLQVSHYKNIFKRNITISR